MNISRECKTLFENSFSPDWLNKSYLLYPSKCYIWFLEMSRVTFLPPPMSTYTFRYRNTLILISFLLCSFIRRISFINDLYTWIIRNLMSCHLFTKVPTSTFHSSEVGREGSRGASVNERLQRKKPRENFTSG